MTRQILMLILLTAISGSMAAQDYIRATATPVVMENGVVLKNAWAGGLNSPQWSEIDVNYDGLMDLMAFDRVGNRLMIFENTGSDYTYTRRYNSAFPGGMENWVVARDFNCDGKNDLAVSLQSGFVIYPNIGDAETGLNFDIIQTPNINNLQMAEFDFSGSPFSAPVFVFSIDMPSFVDHDGDGDMDLFTFTELSSTVYYFKNMSVENGDCTTPQFVCANRCYGYFSESIESFAVFLGEEAECPFNVVDPRSQSGERLHAGGTLLSIDLDGNGIHDLIMSDVTESNMGAFMMEPSSAQRDSAVQVFFDFPAGFSSTDPVQIDIFPAGYYLDINFDGVKDLLVSPNSFAESSDRSSVMTWLNNGADDLPDFQAQSYHFLQNTMIDRGTSAHPVFEDISGDGLPDLIIANRKYYEPGNLLTSQLAYYRNVGTVSVPQFELVEENYLDIPSLGWRNVYPAFGDIDGDGDHDLLIGDNDGFVRVFHNNPGIGGESVFIYAGGSLQNSTGAVIDVGQAATPFLADLNDDGLNDLIIGEKTGHVNFYRNVGTANVPSFELVSETFGNMVATNFLGIDGYSVPLAKKNDMGIWEIFLGSETGQINQYEIPNNDLNAEFGLVNDTYAGIVEGTRCAISMADITGDGLDDLVYGHIGGGVALYLTEEIPVSTVETKSPGFSIYPNPSVDGALNIVVPAIDTPRFHLLVSDATGRKVYEDYFSANRVNIRLPLERGIYFVTVNGDTHKWIIR